MSPFVLRNLPLMSVVFLLIAGWTAACGLKPEAASLAEATHAKQTWSYEGETSPEHWAELAQGAACSGQHQSPIDILTLATVLEDAPGTGLEIRYPATTHIHRLINNGHTLEYDFEPGDSVFFHGHGYTLKQIHFHEPSEHTINGIRYPVEMHLVHTDPAGQVLVLSVLGMEGHNSPPFQFLESYLPVEQGQSKVVDKAFNLLTALPGNRKSFYHYSGSLTTPPCTENVQWIIFETPLEISPSQIEILGKLMPVENYRTVQPLNNRRVTRSFGPAIPSATQ